MHRQKRQTRLGTAATVVAVALAATAALAGCESVAPAGGTGMSVDVRGRPVVVFALCKDHIDGVTVYRDRTKKDPGSEDPSVSVGEWQSSSPVSRTTAPQSQLNIVEPSVTWSTRGATGVLRPGGTYKSYGWTRDNPWFTGHVQFTLERLSTLDPGQVLTQDFVDTSKRDTDTVRSRAQFEARACQ